MSKTVSHLCIFDAHAKPEVPNTRFEALSNFIMENRPSVIIDGGDWHCMPSLCSYDRNTKHFEGRRVLADFRAGNEAISIITDPIVKYNNQRTKNKKRLYRPELHSLGGNHDEGRVNRFLSLNPEHEGLWGLESFEFEKNGWQRHRFLAPVEIHGIAYSHYFVSGTMGRPVASANALLNRAHMSATMGHIHKFDYTRKTNAVGKRVTATFCGCFMDPAHPETYAGIQGNQLFDSGILMKHDVKDGEYDIEWISFQRLMRDYL